MSFRGISKDVLDNPKSGATRVVASFNIGAYTYTMDVKPIALSISLIGGLFGVHFSETTIDVDLDSLKIIDERCTVSGSAYVNPISYIATSATVAKDFEIHGYMTFPDGTIITISAADDLTLSASIEYYFDNDPSGIIIGSSTTTALTNELSGMTVDYRMPSGSISLKPSSISDVSGRTVHIVTIGLELYIPSSATKAVAA